jgi:urea transport system permease protein
VQPFLQQLFIGLSVASILLLAALGLTFTFGQMGIINMAHGEFIMAGAYVPYALQTGVLSATVGGAFALALPLAFVVVGAMGLVLYQLLLRRMLRRTLDTLLVTVGVALIMQQAARDIFGAQNVEVVAPSWLTGNTTLFGVTMPHTRLFIMGLVVAIVGGLSLFLSRAPQGRRMRAVMQHRDLAGVSGLRTTRVDGATFFVGSALAGVAGVAVALIGPIGSAVGTDYVVDAFLVVIVGGVGKLRGTIIAAVALGLLNAYVEKWLSGVSQSAASLAKAVVLACVILFLQFRPNGIVSFRTRGLAT